MGGGTNSVSATNLLASEYEKRRKLTIEKAKANHLSRQLQMRLQYARLKVDHGWQKQNLNEVENLYFHHSHQRGPKPYPTPILIATTQRDAPSFSALPNNPTQSSLSFKLGPSTLSRSHTSASLSAEYDERLVDNESRTASTNTSVSPSTALTLASEATGSGSMGAPLNPAESNHLISMDIDSQKRSPTPIVFSHSIPTSMPPQPHGESALTNNPIRNSKSPRTSQSPAPSWSATPAPSSNKHYSRRQSNSKSVTTPTGDTYGFASSNLTYDSFWSSHSASTGARPFRNSAGNILADVPGENSPNAGEQASTPETSQVNGHDIQTSGTTRGGRRRAVVRSTAGREG